MHELLRKFRDVAFSISLIIVFVLILNITVIHFEWKYIIEFLYGALFVFLGLSIFLFGVDLGITPIGHHMGKLMTHSNRKWVIIIGGLLLGFIVSFAEPSLTIFGQQVEKVTMGMLKSYLLITVVSIGIGLFVSIALYRIIVGFSLKKLLFILYFVILIFAFFVSNDYLAITFDASGATTGSLTVPFLLALTVGVATIKKKHGSSQEDSFGLLGIASAGAIITTLILGLFINTDNLGSSILPDPQNTTFLSSFLHALIDVSISILPIIIIYIVSQMFKIKLSRKTNFKIIKGIIYVIVGLTIFLTGVNGGFMNIGREIGLHLNLYVPNVSIFVIGFFLGAFSILAEPAVYVLTNQIEDVTSGSIKRIIVLIGLALGSGVAIGLSMIRILIPHVQIWHFLLPGYLIAVILSFFTPNIFVGIGFDSGGVASGPMTATFILAFCQGIASGSNQEATLIDGFGMIALVALMPLITIQIFGLLYKIKLKKDSNLLKEE